MSIFGYCWNVIQIFLSFLSSFATSAEKHINNSILVGHTLCQEYKTIKCMLYVFLFLSFIPCFNILLNVLLYLTSLVASGIFDNLDVWIGILHISDGSEYLPEFWKCHL